jgi:hypothetical protein
MPPKKPKHAPAPQLLTERKERPVPRSLRGIADEPPGSHPVWRMSFLDLDHAGTWSWNMVTADNLREITAFLAQMERLTWAEIRSQMQSSQNGRHRKHKPVPIEHLCPEAQRRIHALRLDEFDELFEFRLGNMHRLWGVTQADGVFYAVWWDPDHKVYPINTN